MRETHNLLVADQIRYVAEFFYSRLISLFLLFVERLFCRLLRKKEERKNLFLIVNGKFAYKENLNMKHQKQ